MQKNQIDICEKLDNFINTPICSGYNEYHENYAWNHCYTYFNSLKKKCLDTTLTKSEINVAALQLYSYLGSYGMLRSSGFLFKCNHKILEGVVKIIFKKKYQNLWNLDIKDICSKKCKLNELIREIKCHFICKIGAALKKENKNVTDTLITKILLGTMACTPAFDKNFKNTFKKIVGKTNSKLKGMEKIVKDMCRINDFMKKNESQFSCFKKKHPKYPIMKKIDMYFWQIGAEEEEKKLKKDQKNKL